MKRLNNPPSSSLPNRVTPWLGEFPPCPTEMLPMGIQGSFWWLRGKVLEGIRGKREREEVEPPRMKGTAEESRPVGEER